MLIVAAKTVSNTGWGNADPQGGGIRIPRLVEYGSPGWGNTDPQGGGMRIPRVVEYGSPCWWNTDPQGGGILTMRNLADKVIFFKFKHSFTRHRRGFKVPSQTQFRPKNQLFQNPGDAHSTTLKICKIFVSLFLFSQFSLFLYWASPPHNPRTDNIVHKN